jgi:hypothetical protein
MSEPPATDPQLPPEERLFRLSPSPRIWSEVLAIALLTLGVPGSLLLFFAVPKWVGGSLFLLLIAGELIAGISLRRRSARWAKILRLASLAAPVLGAVLLLAVGLCIGT